MALALPPATAPLPHARKPHAPYTFQEIIFLSFHAHFKLLTPVPCRPCSFGACCCSLLATPAELAPLVAGKKAGPAACIVSDLDVVHVSPAQKKSFAVVHDLSRSCIAICHPGRNHLNNPNSKTDPKHTHGASQTRSSQRPLTHACRVLRHAPQYYIAFPSLLGPGRRHAAL